MSDEPSNLPVVESVEAKRVLHATSSQSANGYMTGQRPNRWGVPVSPCGRYISLGPRSGRDASVSRAVIR